KFPSGPNDYAKGPHLKAQRAPDDRFNVPLLQAYFDQKSSLDGWGAKKRKHLFASFAIAKIIQT
ncbi:hypothetical protein, partial [Segatella buccae]|uniref:hypothetical protein n=1 Tax=Segatella buccae TaxID=28126 RepID=UPI001E3B007D